jgi:hypothetical protein
MSDACPRGLHFAVLEDHGSTSHSGERQDRRGIDDALAEGTVGIVGLTRPRVAVKMHMDELGVRVLEESLQGPADRRVAAVQGQSKPAEFNVARAAEARSSAGRYVLDGDAHPCARLDILQLGDSAEQRLIGARVRRDASGPPSGCTT